MDDLFPGDPFNGQPDLQDVAGRIAESYEELERLFSSLSESPKRLKALPRMPLPSLAIPYELAAIQALRALTLSKAAANLISESNWSATFPVLRALFEVWISLEYAERSFRRLAIEGARWSRYGEIAMRLLRGRTAAGLDEDEQPDDAASIISIGNMLDAVAREIEVQASPAARAIRHHYAELSDYTHPTIWSLVHHLEARPDGLGTIIRREPQPGGSLGPLSDLDLLLSTTIEVLRKLVETADELEDAFRHGPGLDPKVEGASHEALEALASSSFDMTEEEAEVFAARLSALLEHFRTQAGELDLGTASSQE